LQAVVGFDAAVWELWPYLAAGASVHIPQGSVRSNPDAIREWLLTQKISITFWPTTLRRKQVLLLEWPSDTALRILLTGADTLHRRPSPGLPFTLVNNYGRRRAPWSRLSGRVKPEDADGHMPSIGRAIDNTQIYILDGEAATGAGGRQRRLYIGGAGVARGYRNNPVLTAEKLCAIRWVDRPSVPNRRSGPLPAERRD